MGNSVEVLVQLLFSLDNEIIAVRRAVCARLQSELRQGAGIGRANQREALETTDESHRYRHRPRPWQTISEHPPSHAQKAADPAGAPAPHAARRAAAAPTAPPAAQRAAVAHTAALCTPRSAVPRPSSTSPLCCTTGLCSALLCDRRPNSTLRNPPPRPHSA